MKLKKACQNNPAWVSKSAANLCNCCIMGMLDKDNLKGPMTILLLLRQKICDLMLDGVKMDPLPIAAGKGTGKGNGKGKGKGKGKTQSTRVGEGETEEEITWEVTWENNV